MAETKKRRKKKHPFRNFILILLVLCLAVGVYFYFHQDQIPEAAREQINKWTAQTESESVNYKEEIVRRGNVTVGISESGSVSYESIEQTFSVAEVVEVSSSDSSSSSSSSSSASSAQTGMSAMGGDMSGMTGTMTQDQSAGASASSSDSDTSLEVEEIYAAVGQVVEEGDSILKITEDSITEYRNALEASVTSAELVVKQEEINVETKKAEADYNYKMYIATGEVAEDTYNATITNLENEISDLEEDLEEAAEEVADLQEEYDSGYDVEDDLEEAERNYSTIEANLEIARNNLTTGTIEAKQTYDNAITNYKYADQLYEIDTDGLEDDLNDAKETLEEAQEALEEFEEQIGDGIIRAEYSGTITDISYSAGDSLTNDATVVTYQDSSAVTITPSVSQEDISSISVGDTVSIELSAYEGETFSGEVTGISSSSSIGSSTVNYDVEVTFTGDTSKVYSGMTGEVIFVERQEADTLYISNKAVHQDGSRQWVKVLEDDGSISEVTITTGFSNGSNVAVTEGLTEGQTVLIESQVS